MAAQQPFTQPAYQPQVMAGTGGPPQKWSNSFWDCFRPVDMCCLGYWCPCILFGKTQQRLVDPHLQQYETVNGNCLMHLGLQYFGLWWVLQMMKRGELRQRYNLEGSGTGDCCGSYWCACCALMQEEKEVTARLMDNMGAPSQQGYQKNETMGYNPAGQVPPEK